MKVKNEVGFRKEEKGERKKEDGNTTPLACCRNKYLHALKGQINIEWAKRVYERHPLRNKMMDKNRQIQITEHYLISTAQQIKPNVINK